MSLLPGSLGALTLIFMFGLLFLTFLWRQVPVAQRLLIAVPVGYAVWGGVWILVSIVTQGVELGLNDLSTFLTMVLYLTGMVALLATTLTGKLITLRDLPSIIFAYAVTLVFGILFFVRKHLLVTGDSYVWLNWAGGIHETLQDGYPLINLANANLSTMIGVDYYLFIIHPLFALCLTLFMVNFILYLSPRTCGKRLSPVEIVITLGLVIVFSNNPMFSLQAFYVNHHVLFSVSMLVLSYLMLERNTLDGRVIVLVAVLSTVLTLSRMEGFLFAIMAIGCYVFLLTDSSERTRVIGLVIAFNLPYLAYLIAGFWDGAFIDSKQYLVMLAGAVALFVVVRFTISERYVNEKTVGPAMTLGLLLILISLIAFKPVHMVSNLLTFAHNFFDITLWGGATLTPMVVSPWILLHRGLQGRLYCRHDTLFYVFLSALLLVGILIFFRGPLIVGFQDSANRMVFHFLPLAYAWIGIELVRLINESVKSL